MPARLPQLFLVGAALAFGLRFPAAAAPDDPPADPADDPLPAGAMVRYGVTRPILRGSPAVAPVPPAFTDFLAPPPPAASAGTTSAPAGRCRRRPTRAG